MVYKASTDILSSRASSAKWIGKVNVMYQKSEILLGGSFQIGCKEQSIFSEMPELCAGGSTQSLGTEPNG